MTMDADAVAITPEPKELAQEAHLQYVNDTLPGFTRVLNGKQIIFLDVGGKQISNHTTLERISHLAIPPAWRNVWISPVATGHIQAIGHDEKNRKQYIYHSSWIALSKQHKFDKMLIFSESLPEIRAKIAEDMQLPTLSDKKVFATIVWLLEHTYIRIGNEVYAKENRHFGLTTLRNRHVHFSGSVVEFEFTGKSGIKHVVDITNPRIIKTIHTLEELPGYELFQYITPEGTRHKVHSEDVNAYIKQLTGKIITAKDFRTWGATLLSATTLHNIGIVNTKKQIKENITKAVKIVSSHLGNTPAVCRNYYIHPVIPLSYEKSVLIPHFQKMYQQKATCPKYFSIEEFAVQQLLRQTSFPLDIGS